MRIFRKKGKKVKNITILHFTTTFHNLHLEYKLQGGGTRMLNVMEYV